MSRMSHLSQPSTSYLIYQVSLNRWIWLCWLPRTTIMYHAPPACTRLDRHPPALFVIPVFTPRQPRSSSTFVFRHTTDRHVSPSPLGLSLWQTLPTQLRVLTISQNFFCQRALADILATSYAEELSCKGTYQFSWSASPVGLLNLLLESCISRARLFISLTNSSISLKMDFQRSYMAMSIDQAFQSSLILAGNLLFLDQQSMRSPKVQASTTAASFPLGSSSPQRRSWIVSQVPCTSRAEVPMADTAFLLMLTRTCSGYMATVVKPQPLDQLHADKESHDFCKRGDFQAGVRLLAVNYLSAGQVHDEPGPGGDAGVGGREELGEVGVATDGASGGGVLLESGELGGALVPPWQFQEAESIHNPIEINNLIQFMLIAKLLSPRRPFSSFSQRLQPLLEGSSPDLQQQIHALWKKEIEALEKLQSQVLKERATLETHLQELRSDSQKKLQILKKNLENAKEEKALLQPRMAKELQNAKSFALTKFAKELIDVADNLRLFTDSIDKENLNSLFKQQVKASCAAMFQTLALYGIKPIESDNQPFDPNFHQAVVEIPSPSEDKQGLVVTTTQRGYVLNGRVLRSAKVIVYQKL